METKEIYKIIADNIKSLRVLNGYTQEYMAELLNTTPRYYSSLETGDRNFTIEKIVDVSTLFNVPIEHIISIPKNTLDDKPSEETLDQINKKLFQMTSYQALLVDRIIDLIMISK